MQTINNRLHMAVLGSEMKTSIYSHWRKMDKILQALENHHLKLYDFGKFKDGFWINLETLDKFYCLSVYKDGKWVIQELT